jgi:hypothetical protein
MIKQDKQSWNKGRADAMRGAPSKCPSGLDEPAGRHLRYRPKAILAPFWVRLNAGFFA